MICYIGLGTAQIGIVYQTFHLKKQLFQFLKVWLFFFAGTSKGYGLVKYESKSSSLQARHVLEGYEVRNGHILDCDWLQYSNRESITSLHSKCLYVDKLPPDYRDMAQFRRLFSKIVNPPYCQVRMIFLKN